MDADVKKRIFKFESYVNDVLKADLAKLAEKLDSKTSDLAEFLQLKGVIKTLKNEELDKNGFKTKVDIGCNFYIQAHVEDASKLLLDVGLGHYVEFSLDEALLVIDVRIKLLERQIHNLRKEIAKTNGYIKLMLLGISELQGFT